MNNLTPNVIRARRKQYLTSIVTLNGKREMGRLVFFITLGLGLLIFIVAAAMGNLLIGLIIFIITFAIAGLSGLLGWLGAERKIAKFRALLAELDRAEMYGQEFSTRTARPGPASFVPICYNCGSELVSTGKFCQVCGAHRMD